MPFFDVKVILRYSKAESTYNWEINILSRNGQKTSKK
jgi:hypothetical protein